MFAVRSLVKYYAPIRSQAGGSSMETITDGISPERAELLARLAAERSHLLLQLEGAHVRRLESEPVAGELFVDLDVRANLIGFGSRRAS